MSKPAQQEGAVDWEAAAKFHNTGKVEETAPETPEGTTPEPASDLVDVSINGTKVKMTSEAAKEYEAFVKKTRERDGRLGGELSQLRERSAKLEGQIEQITKSAGPARHPLADIKPPPPELAEQDLAAWQRQMIEYNAAMLQLQKDELRAEYEAEKNAASQAVTEEQTWQAWVDKFYADNPHLNNPDIKPIVQAVYGRHQSEIHGYGNDVEGAHAELARLTGDALVRIKAEGKTEEATQRPPNLESQGSKLPPNPATESPQRLTAQDWVRKRRAQLRGEKV